MNPTIQTLAASYIVPALLSRVKFRWIVYGAVAYYGIKLLNEKGMLPAQASNVLDTVNQGISQGIDMAKDKIGFSQSSQSTASTTSAPGVGGVH